MQHSSSYHGGNPSYAGPPVKADSFVHLSPYENNFRLLRFFTALTVAATHCLWVVYGFNPSKEGLIGILIQASHCGICIFFGLSGYLITASLMERPNYLRYTISRILRLCPLLLFSSLLLAFVAGPLFTTATTEAYYNDWHLWAFIPLSTLSFSELSLPGLFETAPAGSDVNVSLWTLKYEIAAYIGLAALSILGLLHRRLIWIWAGVAIAAFIYVSYFTQLRIEIDVLQHGFRFGFAFLIGLILFSYKDIIPLNFIGVLLVIGFAAYTNSTAYMEPFRILALTYTAIWFGSQKAGLLNFYNRFGDYSYGIFVFHWPIAQMVLQLNPSITYAQLLLVVMPLTMALAVISWHGIEEPLLSARYSLADKLQSWFRSLRYMGVTTKESFVFHVSDQTYQWGKRGFDIMTSYPAPESRPQTPEQVATQRQLEEQNNQQLSRHYNRVRQTTYEEFGYMPYASDHALRDANPQVESLSNQLCNDVPASFRPQATGYSKPLGRKSGH